MHNSALAGRGETGGKGRARRGKHEERHKRGVRINRKKENGSGVCELEKVCLRRYCAMDGS